MHPIAWTMDCSSHGLVTYIYSALQPSCTLYSSSVISIDMFKDGLSRKPSRDSEDLRKAAIHNAFWKRQDILFRTNGSASEPWDMSQSAAVLPPLTASKGATSASISAAPVMSPPMYSMNNLRRHVTSSVDFPPHSSADQPRPRGTTHPKLIKKVSSL